MSTTLNSTSTHVMPTGQALNDLILMNVFGYIPAKENCYAFIVLFACVSVVILGLNITYRNHDFNYILFVAGLLEVLGYAMRLQVLSKIDVASMVISEFVLILCPILLALVNYLVVARFMQMRNKGVCCIKPKVLSALFLCSDVLCFFIQASAGGLISQGNNFGINLLVIGLVLQLAFFSLFIYIMTLVAFGPEWRMWDAVLLRESFICLYITSGLIYLRNIYRIVSYSSPGKSDINTHEGYFIAFEGTAIFLTMVVYTALHFGRVLPPYPEAYITPGLLIKEADTEEGPGCAGCAGCPGRSVLPGCVEC
jgi:hypothetical protein